MTHRGVPAACAIVNRRNGGTQQPFQAYLHFECTHADLQGLSSQGACGYVGGLLLCASLDATGRETTQFFQTSLSVGEFRCHEFITRNCLPIRIIHNSLPDFVASTYPGLKCIALLFMLRCARVSDKSATSGVTLCSLHVCASPCLKVHSCWTSACIPRFSKGPIPLLCSRTTRVKRWLQSTSLQTGPCATVTRISGTRSRVQERNLYVQSVQCRALEPSGAQGCR